MRSREDAPLRLLEEWGLCVRPVLQDSRCVLLREHEGPCEDNMGNRVKQQVPLGARKQKAPVDRGSPDVTKLVCADLEARAHLGEVKYGTRLRPFNSRDALLDAYQEMLDMVEYMRQRLYEDYGE